MTAELIVQIGMMILAAAATYGAIRQDIRNIHEKIERVSKDADKAHERIDEILNAR